MPILVRAMVKPELLMWARTSARLDEEQAARKAQVGLEQLRSWEKGEAQPTIGQLRKLGRVYKRPLAVFYLPKPPRDFQALHDFRRLPEADIGRQTPELAFEIRRARDRREIALELYRDLTGNDPPSFELRAAVSDDPEAVALRLRTALGVERSEPLRWKNNYDALNRWRTALEDAWVLVFQAEDVTVEEMRGFSVSDTPLPVVAVNIKDAVAGRIFSMLHEVTHVMLREGGLCDVDEASAAQQAVEVFCNRVAGATLVPSEWLLDEDVVRGQQGVRWPDEATGSLAHRYRVSREVILRRLLMLGRTSEAFYKEKRKQFQGELEAQQELELQKQLLGLATPGFVTPDRMAVSTAGPLFVRLVLASYHQEKITANDLSRFLEVRLKHLPKIERAVVNRQLPTEAR
jgi:Zn-dependent peptidase ImmA (M78 family)